MKQKLEYLKAKVIADEILELLKPHCFRIEIAGSIRRKKEFIGDIEIVAIPKPYSIGLFEDGLPTVVNKWKKVKGELEYGVCKYTQRELPQGINLDIFFCEEDNFGNIYLIRTGDWQFSKNIMYDLSQKGYKHQEGYLFSRDRKIVCKEEIDIFNRLGIEYIEPEKRTIAK